MQARVPPQDQLLAHIWEFIQQRNIQSAVNACQTMNIHYPDNANGWYAGSYLALQLGGHTHALQSIEKALNLESENQRWLLHKAACLHASGHAVSAIDLLNSVAKTEHSDRNIFGEIGLQASRFGEYPIAILMFNKAIEHQPEEARLHFNLATVLRFQGKLAEAETACAKALRLNPEDYDSLYLRSNLSKQELDSNHIEELRNALEKVRSNLVGEALISFALAKEYEDLGDSSSSFVALARGAKARRSSLQYDVSEDVDFLNTIREVYSKELMSQAHRGYENDEPIFVLGLPRTGTTLVERILGSHDSVVSTGELTVFTRTIAAMAQMISQQNPALKISSRNDMARMTARIDFTQLGQAYIESARNQLQEPSKYFIDKFPQNTLNIGPIKLALPGAKIILLQRHPMDSCYSMFKQLFTDIYQFSYDLEELGKFFIAHQRLLDHWLEVAGDSIHVVQYENLVQNPEPEVRKLLEFCKLPWQDQCLKFHQNPQASTTASASQVRQKLYSSSIGKWKDYKQQLEPLRKMLDEAGFLK